jgi:hypothetical protein
MRIFKFLSKKKAGKDRRFVTLSVWKQDKAMLKGLSKKQGMTIAGLVHVMIPMWMGVQEGIKTADIDKLQLERDAAVDLLREYKDRFGMIKVGSGKKDRKSP